MSKLQRAKDARAREAALARNTAIASAVVGGLLEAGADAVVLSKLPTGYSTEADGKGKPFYTNRRVQLLGAVTVGLAIWGGRSLSSRVAMVTAAGLLGAAVRNHFRQYNSIVANTTEVYP